MSLSDAVKARRQDLFNRSVAGLASQGFSQSRADGYCAYRGSEGKRCAAGWLIPDDQYAGHLEGKGIRSIWSPKMGIDPDDIGLLEDLQGAHDTGLDPKGMKAKLTGVAWRHGLDVPPELTT